MTQKRGGVGKNRRGQDGARARPGWVQAQRAAVFAVVRAEVAGLLRTHGSQLRVTEAVWELRSRVGPDVLERRQRVTVDLQRAAEALDAFAESLPVPPDIERERSRDLTELFASLSTRLDAVRARFPVIAGPHVERRAARPLLAEILDSTPDGPWWSGLASARDLALVSLLMGNFPEKAKAKHTAADVIALEREKMRTARADNASRAARLARERADVDAAYPPEPEDPAFLDL